MSTNPDHIDNLAWIIREVDEDNQLTAPQLAEAILKRYPCAFLVDPPAAPPAPEVGRLEELILCLQIRAASLGAEGENLRQRGDAFYFDRAATLLQQLSAPAPALVPVAAPQVPKWLLNKVKHTSSTMAEAIRTTVANAGATPAQSLLEPTARAAAIAQLWHLPWAHPHALELRRKFRLLEEGQR